MKKILLLPTLFFMLPQFAMGQDDSLPFTYDTIYQRAPLTLKKNTISYEELSSLSDGSTDISQTSETGNRNSSSLRKQRRGNWHFGGTFGLGFGDYTNINISPQIGYSWNRYFTLGGGISYNYYDNDYYNYSLNYLGFHLYGRAYPIDYLTLYVQPEVQRRWGTVRGYDTGSDVFGCLLLGAGTVLPIGYRSGITVTFYYDVIQNKYTPYGNRIGYSVGYSFAF